MPVIYDACHSTASSAIQRCYPWMHLGLVCVVKKVPAVLCNFAQIIIIIITVSAQSAYQGGMCCFYTVSESSRDVRGYLVPGDALMMQI